MQYSIYDIYDAGRAHYNELLREAEYDRLARKVRAEHPALHYTIMAWTGRRLMDAGRILTSAAENARQPQPVRTAEMA